MERCFEIGAGDEIEKGGSMLPLSDPDGEVLEDA